jgi:hypothetical protein
MVIFLYLMLPLSIAYCGLNKYAAPALRRQLGWLPFLSIAGLYAVAAVTPRPEPLLLAAFLIPLVRTRTRADVACRYVLLMPLMPDVTATLVVGGHVLAQTTPFTAFSLGALLAGATARDDQPRPEGARFRPEHGVLLMLLVAFGVASPRFGDPSALIRGVVDQLLLLVVPFLVLTTALRSRDTLARAIACFGASAVILALPALYEHHAGWSLFDALTSHIAGTGYMARSASIRGGALRPAMTMATPIEFGIFLMLGLFALGVSRDFFTRRRAGLVAMGVVGLALLAAQTRGAVLSLGAGILVVQAARRRWGTVAGVAAAGGILYGMLWLASNSSVRVAAFMGAGQNFGDYKDYRTLLLARGMEEGAKHRWLGASLNQVTDELADLTQGEHIIDFVNTYLNIYLVAGLIGLGLLVIALMAVVVGLLRRTGADLSRDEERPRMFCLAALTGILLSLATTSFFGRVPFMLMFVLAGARLLRATDSGPRRPVVPPVLEQLRREAAERERLASPA